MKGNILLADDDPEILASLSAALSSEGYEVIPANNGREACTCFAKHQVDLALLDLKMPVRDGWAAFEKLTNTNPLVPIIIITARPDQYPLLLELKEVPGLQHPLDEVNRVLDQLEGLE